MNLNAKIYVAGHRGLVGSALMRQLNTQKKYDKEIRQRNTESGNIKF